MAAKAEQTIGATKTISVCHDVEAGFGHRDEDSSFAAHADRQLDNTLEAMLDAERRAGILATYHVVGKIVGQVRDRIAAGGHCLAFHSYDHRVERTSRLEAALSKASRALLGRPTAAPHSTAHYQLRRCRIVDYRLKGYRAPQSRVTGELTAENLCHYNFEWLASSAKSLRSIRPAVKNRVVRIPIHFDDWSMYRGRLRYGAWERKALATVAKGDAVAFSLHDCYADWWLSCYPRFLDRIQQLGTLRTLDEVAAAAFLSAGA
jgi:peptidoglycan/xylan/chitin deacetylase (PgdA/CDA1 family)